MADYNDYVLTTSLDQGWISEEQRSAVRAALVSMPQVSALDFLHEQGLLTDPQAKALEDAIAQAQSAAPPESDGAASSSRIEVEERTAPSTAAYAAGFNHVDDFLRFAKEAGASDVHIGVSAPPLMRLNGILQPLWADAPILTAEQTESLLRGFVTDEQWKHFRERLFLEFSYQGKEGRFRTSLIQQRKGFDGVFRIINTKVRTMDELGLPESLKVLTKYHNGLVLVTGAVGSGKSTTLAALVEEINNDRHDHIISLEDPIEFLFTAKGCQITQREVHSHTESFAAALRGSLRQDPDVIMVGEMRDLETIQLAITASETGHLVLGTLHTSSASRTLDRVLDAFPIEQQAQIRTMVSESLRGIISQQLIPRVDGKSRALALEVLVNTPAVANLIREAKTFMLPGIIQTGKKLGMRLMDDSLLELVRNKVIRPEDAFDRAEQKNLFQQFLT